MSGDFLNGLSKLSLNSLGENNKTSGSDNSVETDNSFSENKNQLQGQETKENKSPQEKIQKILDDFKTKTPDEIKNIMNHLPKEILVFVYKNTQYLKGLRELPLENKIAIIESLGNNTDFLNTVRNGNQADFDIRYAIKNKILPSQSEQKEWLKILILSGKNKTDSEKSNTKDKITNYFLVTDIVSQFGYYRDSAAPSFAKRALSPDVKYEKTLEQNEKIRSWFLNKMLDVGQQYSDIKETGSLEQDTISVITNYVSDDGRLIGVIEGLATLDERQQKIINDWDHDVLRTFLKNILSDATNENNVLDMTDHGIETRSANEIGAWFTLANNQNRITASITELSRKGLSSAISEPIKVQILKLKGNNIKQNYSELSQYEEATSIYRLAQRKAQEVVTKKNKKEGKTLTKLQNEIAVSNQLEEELKLLLDTENLPEDKQEEINKILNDAFDQNNQDLLVAAEKYGFTEDLKQARGAEYYAEVEQRYITQQQTEIQQYQNTESGQEFQKVGQKLMGEKEFSQFFEQNQITSDKLKGDLSDEEYKNLLIKNESESDPQNQERLQKQNEYTLLDTTNNEVKNRFVDRITYFFSNILDVQIDKDGKENILKDLKIDQNKVENNQITIQGKHQNKDLTFTYNIATGELFTGKRLHIDKNNQNVSVGNTMQKLDNVSGPTFDEHIQQTDSISYSDILKKSQGNQEKYKEELDKQLTIKCPLPNQTDSFKEEMKLQSLKNIVAQEIFETVGLEDKQWTDKGIDGSTNTLFPLLARSIETYDKDQLLQTRFVIKDMVDFHQQQKQVEGITSQESINPKLNELAKDTKDDKYKPLKKITSKLFSIRNKEKIKSNYMGEQFTSFFNSFLSEKSKSNDGHKIIDPKKLYTYYEDLHQTENKSVNKEYFSALQENMQPLFATEGLENYTENLLNQA